ncbi:MAG: serine/threonine protein phosphatase [Candidatus Adiutrix sp.]|nr:serine/threonine protein phosphatase [Candidatus Adiutrix sp.]
MNGRRILAVGDIHGCHAKLVKILSRLDFQPQNGDILVFLGDYIDRGPHSLEVLETLTELVIRSPGNVVTLLGNHEKMFLDFISGAGMPQLFGAGLASTVRSFAAGDGEFTQSHMMFLRNLKLYYETDDYIFVHAGLRPGLPLSRQSDNDLLWIRDDFLNNDYDFGKTIIFGHTPFQEPLVTENRIGLDTGAVFGGPLTAVVLPERRFIFAD